MFQDVQPHSRCSVLVAPERINGLHELLYGHVLCSRDVIQRAPERLLELNAGRRLASKSKAPLDEFDFHFVPMRTECRGCVMSVFHELG
jgi:hypothetical protein